MDAHEPQHGWFQPALGPLVLALLIVECLLWLSNWAGWWHKGYAVLMGVAVLCGTVSLLLLWFLIALIFRWRFQFSLRSLLLLTIAVPAPFSWLAGETRRAREQRETVDAIKKSRGSVLYDWQYSTDAAKTSTARQPARSWLRSMLGDDFFATIVHVGLYGSHVTDADLGDCIGRLPHLRSLSLSETPHVTNAGLQHIRALIEIQRLYLNTWTITDASLNDVAELPQLEELHLGGTKVTNIGLDKLKALRHLHSLILNDTEVTDGGLKTLAGLSQLQLVDLRNTEVTDEGVAKLQQALPNCTIRH